MGEMKRAIAREQTTRYKEEQRMTDRFSSTLVIAASIIAGIRLRTGREHQSPLSPPSDGHRRLNRFG